MGLHWKWENRNNQKIALFSFKECVCYQKRYYKFCGFSHYKIDFITEVELEEKKKAAYAGSFWA